jgi:hypothetical protein
LVKQISPGKRGLCFTFEESAEFFGRDHELRNGWVEAGIGIGACISLLSGAHAVS